MTTTQDGCGAPDQAAPLPASVDVEKETVITGVVQAGDTPVGGAYVRLLDASGEFTAEVVTSAAGQFRFFAAPGTWTAAGAEPRRATATPPSPPTAASTRSRWRSRNSKARGPRRHPVG